MMKPLLIIGCLLALVSAAGCGGSSSSSTVSYRQFEIPVPHNPHTNIAIGKLRYGERMHPGPSGLVGKEPKPIIPNSPPPEFLVIQDLIDGIGSVPKVGQRVTVQWVGYDYNSRRKFGSSWDEGRPLSFTLGAGEVIPAWEEGLEGIELGDRRELVVPPELAQGSVPPGIPPGKNVAFIVELLPKSSEAKAEKPSQAK